MDNTTTSGKSALGLDANITALLGYIVWVVALISLIIEKESRFVRFHAIQSLLYHAAILVVWIALAIIMVFLGIGSAVAGQAGGAIGGIFGSLLGLVGMVIFVAYIAGLIYAAVQAYGGKWFKLPIVGNMAEKWAGPAN
jgi:uncharacterized membrane protein